MKKNQSAVNLKNASWSHQYGISKENNGSPLFGLNPNMNIEDEYIENLLKQIHFMNMQIKLLKEKQALSQGNSMWAIINRSNQPLVKNIVDSNQKYQFMKKNIDSNVNKTQYQNSKLADQQTSLVRKMNHLQDKIKGLYNVKQDKDKKYQASKQKITTKVKQLQQKLKSLLAQKQVQLKKNKDLIAQNQDLTNNLQKQKFLNAVDAKKIKNEEDIELQIEQDLIKQIQDYKRKIKDLQFDIENNNDYKKAKQIQKDLKQQNKKVNNTISQHEFQLLMITQAIKLAQKEKDKEILQRKKLMEEFQSLKVILKEIQTLNDARLKQQINIKKRQSLDIQKGQTQSKKLQKTLQQIKRKLIRTQQSQKILRQEVQYLQRQFSKLKNKRQALHDNFTKLSTKNNIQDTKQTTKLNLFKQLQNQCEKNNHDQFNSIIQLNQIQAQIMSLRQRKEYLTQTLDLKQALNQTRLEELKKVVDKNKDVNQTVEQLMGKWNEIKVFSKM